MMRQAGGPAASGRSTVGARTIRPRDLEPQHLETWRRLQCAHVELDRPFFCPEYIRVLGEVRDDVEVAVIERDGAAQGFFPFQRVSPRVAAAPGRRLCDFEGLVAPPDLEVDPVALLADCGLRAWRFAHLLGGPSSLEPWQAARVASPTVDLSSGYEGYLADRRAAGVHWVSQLPRKTRKLEREVGPLRFEYDARDPGVSAQVFAWKASQRERTLTDDPLQHAWMRQVMERLLECREPGFSSVVSALYAGPHLIAGHVGLKSRRTLHLWFPSFDLAYERYSPGLLMMTALIRAAAEAGLTRVDLGKGDDRYKLSLATGAVAVAEGCVDTRPFRGWVSRAFYAGRGRYRGTALEHVLRGPKRRLRRLLRRWAAAD
jgi:CelD/BcsL family acetyltransferase involved in cellulose biosynthesis